MARLARFLNGFALIASLATVALSANASHASASVTIGQLGDSNAGNCDAGVDFVQLGTSSGNPYVVPGAGTITSWTVAPAADRGTLSIKLFRKLADPARFQVVGHAGPQMRTPGGTAPNTFPANIQVRPGDLLGLHTVNATPCAFKDPGGLPAVLSGDLADGEAAAFTPQAEFDLDIQAVFVPDNEFSFGAAARNKRKGTATLAVDVPNPGELALSGKGINTLAAKRIPAAGKVELPIKAKGSATRKLRRTGKVSVTARITYIPTGGDPNTRSRGLRLKRL
jgi:hypothetical protein